MAENKMREVAALLGVEIGEEFYIKGRATSVFRLVFNGIQEKNEGLWDYAHEGTLLNLIYGELEIIKRPWKPKIGEQYFFPSLESELGFDCYKFHEGDDCLIINKFIACETREEAVELHDWIVKQVKKYRGIE